MCAHLEVHEEAARAWEMLIIPVKDDVARREVTFAVLEKTLTQSQLRLTCAAVSVVERQCVVERQGQEVEVECSDETCLRNDVPLREG